MPRRWAGRGNIWGRRGGARVERRGMQYVRQGNCFPWVEQWSRAQQLLDRQVRTNWPQALGRLARELNPLHARMFRNFPVDYYWTTYQSEWAIDVRFPRGGGLGRRCPRGGRSGVTVLGCRDVLRFLGGPVGGGGGGGGGRG